MLAVVATALILLAANSAKAWISRARAQRTAALKAQADLTVALLSFNESAAKIAAAMDGIAELPKFMAGFVKICQAFVVAVEKQRKSSDQLASLILRGQDPKEAHQAPTDEEKDIAFRITEKMVQGMDREQAAQQIADEDLKKNNYGVMDL